MFYFKLGSIYSISYSRWKTNPVRIFIFVLWGNPVTDKIHALNLGAKQLTTLQRARLMHTIVKLSKAPNAHLYNGRLLYRIFLTYLPKEVRTCYRTYFHTAVTAATLINYGLNKEEDFTSQDLRVYNPAMALQAKQDFLIKTLNLYSRRGVNIKAVQDALAQTNTKLSQLQQQQQTQTEKQSVVHTQLDDQGPTQKEVQDIKDQQNQDIQQDQNNPSNNKDDKFNGTGY